MDNYTNTVSRVLAIEPSFLQQYLDQRKCSSDKNYKASIESLRLLHFSSADKIGYPWAEDVNEGSIALHVVDGAIYYNHWWRFSTLDFMQELRAADANPAFIAHLIYINSPGGESFGLNEAHEVIRNLSKPVYAVIDSVGCSAAYYIASAADKIYVTSPISLIGSIGCMATLTDWSKYDEKIGIKEIELYATRSTLKNKAYRDALDGKTKEYIEKFLDPVLELFIENVKTGRPNVDDSVFEGDSYYTPDAMNLHLVDGIRSLDQVVAELLSLEELKKLGNQITHLF